MLYTRETVMRWGKGSGVCKVSFLVTCGFFKALAMLVLQTEATRAQKSNLYTFEAFLHLIPILLIYKIVRKTALAHYVNCKDGQISGAEWNNS